MLCHTRSRLSIVMITPTHIRTNTKTCPRSENSFRALFTIPWISDASDDNSDGYIHQNKIALASRTHQTDSFILSAMINTLRPRQNGRHFADDIFKCIFLNENVWIQIEISLKFVPKGPINNNPSLVQIMAWCRSGDKPLSEPMINSLMTHIWVTRPQWVHTTIKNWQYQQW